MRIIIAGGRDFNNYNLLEEECLNLFESNPVLYNFVEIISGHANGADKLGEAFAKKHNYLIRIFDADWNNLDSKPCLIKYNKSGSPYNALAGFNRNRKMAECASENNGMLMAFWDGKSPGTKNMIDIAKELKLKVSIIPI